MISIRNILILVELLFVSLLYPVVCLTPDGRFIDGSFRSSRGIKHRSSLAANKRRRYRDEDFDDREYDQSSPQRSIDRPTQTAFDQPGPKLFPDKPKIVVLGASGRIGRLVVRQLLETGSEDMTICAYVRNYDKACRVLYDDLIPVTNKGKGPNLQIYFGDLVPKNELRCLEEEELEEEQEWIQKAQSATNFYGTNITDYDNRELLPNVNEALEDAIKDCTCVIRYVCLLLAFKLRLFQSQLVNFVSCVGSVRLTNVWTDILAVPLWRLLKTDVSRWCKDRSHPYYVHYVSTRKALGYAEREQLRREAAVAASVEESNENTISTVPRIRFIRISDLCVGFRPWNFVPLVTNVIQSVVFRYQEMTEQLLDQSTVIETMILRPGDLTDEERDVHTTGLQVCSSGMVPLPARVSREDVASLAVAAAMHEVKSETVSDKGPFHYTLGVRWVGQEMNPYPPQGRKMDGLPDAELALKRSINAINKADERSKRRKELLSQKQPNRKRVQSADMIQKLALRLNQRKLRQNPHGICVAIPVYFFLGLAFKTFVFPLLQYIPGARTVILPGLSRLNSLFLAMVTPLFRYMLQLWPQFAQRKQYIRF